MNEPFAPAFAQWANEFQARDYPVLTPLLPPMLPIEARRTISVAVRPWRMIERCLNWITERLEDLTYWVSKRAVRDIPNPKYDPAIADRYFVKQIKIGQSYHPDIASE